MSSDRRQFQRMPLGASVAYQEITFAKTAEPEQSVYRDVSGGGILLSSAKEVPLGTLLKVEIRLPGWGKHQNRFGPASESELRPLVAVGQIVRVEQMEAGDYELGVKFLNVYPDDQAALLKFIAASSPADEKLEG